MSADVEPQVTGKAILVVEDSPTESFALKKILEKVGHLPFMAKCADEALEILNENSIDMILSDIDMPGMNGYELCLRIKSNDEWKTIPVILLTTLSSPLNLLQGLKARADYYLTKPYTSRFLLSRVNRLLASPPGAPDPEVEPLTVTVQGNDHQVTAGRRQMLNLMMSTYESAVRQNHDLITTQAELHEANQQLQEKQEQLRVANDYLTMLAATDGLTGLKNHRVFKERIEDEFQKAARYSIPLSLMMIDVDQFKQFNDSFGHPAGDEVLKKVAKLLLETTRNTDLVARYGGEEFAVLLPVTDNDAAFALAERIRATIYEAEWEHRGISVSIGVTTMNADTRTAATLVALADGALYHSKQTGRNRVSRTDDLPGQGNTELLHSTNVK